MQVPYSPKGQVNPGQIHAAASPARSTPERAGRAVWERAPVLVIPIALLLMVPNALTPLALVAVPGLFAARWVGLGSPLPRTRLNLPLLLFLGMFALTFALTPARAEALILSEQLLAGITLLFVMYDHTRSIGGIWNVTGIVVGIGALLALLTPFSVTWRGLPSIPLPWIYDHGLPTFLESTNSNVMAGALVPIPLLALALLFAPTKPLRLIGIASLPLVLLMLFLLQARAAWFGVLVGVAVWVTLRNRWLVPVVPIVLLVALIANNALGGPSPAQLLYGPVGTDVAASFGERQDLWAQAVRLIQGAPLLGIGLGAYPMVAPYAPPFSVQAPGKVLPHAHNLFLQLGLDLGILGLVGFAWMWLRLIADAWHARKRPLIREVALGVLATFAAMLAYSIGESVFWGFKASLVMWLVFGLALLFDKSTIEL